MDKIITTRHFISAMILAGLGDEAIIDILMLHQLPHDTSDINKVRKILDGESVPRSMIKANQLRYKNGEQPIINDIVIVEYEYEDDLIALINNVTFATSLHDRGKLKDIKSTEILQDDKKRSCVENFALILEDFSLMEELTKELGLEKISEDEYKRYCYFYFEVNNKNQQELAAYLRNEQKQNRYGKQYINSLNEGFREIINMLGSPKENDIKQNINKLCNRTIQDINTTLENGKSPNRKSISRLRSLTANLDKLGGPLNRDEVSPISDEKYGSFMSQDKPHPVPPHHIFITPHHNLIKVCIYAGYTNEMVESLMEQLGFNTIPGLCMKRIYDECNDTDGGAELLESADVRKTFHDTDTYHSLFKWLQEESDLSLFPLKEIIFDRDKRSFLENAIMVSLDPERLKKAWYEKFREKLTTDQLEIFRYYFWNLKVDFKEGLLQYLRQDPHNSAYQEHRALFDKDHISFLSHHHLLTPKEKEIKLQLAWSRQNHMREEKFQKGDYYLPPAQQNSLFMFLEKTMENDKRVDKAYYRTQLERIFSRITGKVRYNYTRDQLNNRSRPRKQNEQDTNIMKEVN
ncbi:MAG: hypothetical protein PF570_05570 [Candidatus Cloacimonetes bacterium]|jgi:hypothetical protein|nr:hypothetical protein [Candidatus Cloacimonadota bacterium]